MNSSMEPMKAIVLSCDRYHAFAYHMIACYEALWSDHPFIFRVPWQHQQPVSTWGPIEPIRTGERLRETVLELIQDISDDTFVYWCIDDKFPIWLDTAAIHEALDFLRSDGALGIDNLLLCRAGNHWKKKNLLNSRITLPNKSGAIARANYKHIWLHQFTRAKVIRHLFSNFPEAIPTAKDMDALKNQISKPSEHHLYVTEHSHCLFQESTSRGKITQDCLEGFQSLGMNVPAWAIQLRPSWLTPGRRG